MSVKTSNKQIIVWRWSQKRYETVVTIADMPKISLSQVDKMTFKEVTAIVDVMRGPVAMRAVTPYVKELFHAALDRQNELVDEINRQRDVEYKLEPTRRNRVRR